MVDTHTFLEFQAQIEKVKYLKRTGWIIRSVPGAETVAAHSWRMAWMALYKEKELKNMGVDTDCVLHMCLLHDVGESVVGDIIPEIHQTGRVKISAERKQKIETQAVTLLADKYHFPLLKTVFDSYEAQESMESKVVKNLDKLDMLMQAYEYSRAYPHLARLKEFMECNEQDVNLPLFKKDVAEIKSRQFDHKSGDNQFVDALESVGVLKHQVHDPTASSIPDYDTTAAHLFRAGVMALYFKPELEREDIAFHKLMRSLIEDNKDISLGGQMASDLKLLENIHQAYHYTKRYPKNNFLKTYILKNQEKIKTPFLQSFIPEQKKCSLLSFKEREHTA